MLILLPKLSRQLDKRIVHHVMHANDDIVAVMPSSTVDSTVKTQHQCIHLMACSKGQVWGMQAASTEGQHRPRSAA